MSSASFLKQRLYFAVFRTVTFLCVSVLLAVLVLLVAYGHSALTWQFLVGTWVHHDITQGGIRDAIVGSLYIGIGVSVLSFAVGISTAIYLTEYCTNRVWKRFLELSIRNLAGVPTVVYGLFGLAVFVSLFHFGMSILSALLTLSIISLPWNISASVEALQAVPESFREASMALGATKFQTLRKLVFPSALPGCITGSILSIARAMGDTAAIILVGAAFYLSHQPHSPFDQFMALPYTIYILATQHASPLARTYAAAASVVLILLIFFLSLGAIIIRYRYRMKRYT